MTSEDEVLEEYTRRVEHYVRSEVARMARLPLGEVDELEVGYNHRRECFEVRVPSYVVLDDPGEVIGAIANGRDPTAPNPIRTRHVPAETYRVTLGAVDRAVRRPDYWRDALLGLITALADADRAAQRKRL